jgi:hypothetical protein
VRWGRLLRRLWVEKGVEEDDVMKRGRRRGCWGLLLILLYTTERYIFEELTMSPCSGRGCEEVR